jgi:integrase
MIQRQVGRPKRELFLRSGIYFARFRRPEGKKDIWSTGTTDPVEAARRLSFMRIKNQPWKSIEKEIDPVARIIVSPEGDARGQLTTSKISGNEIITTIEKAHPDLIIERYDEEKGIKKAPTEEPGKNCADLIKLLDYEYTLKEKDRKPKNTLRYYRERFAFMKQYVAEFGLSLTTFRNGKCFDYIKYRLGQVAGKKGDLGYNGKPAGISTVNKEIKLFRALWRTWMDEGRVPENPWARVKLLRPTGVTEEIEKAVYSLEEVKNILDHIKNENVRSILIFQAFLGIRPGLEVLNINREMIQSGRLYNLKKRRWDIFKFPSNTLEFFEQHIEGKTTGITPGFIYKCFVKACKTAKIRVGKPYDLRHCFATTALQDVKIETVSQLLRHAELKTTQIYARPMGIETAEAREKMSKKIFNAVKEDKPDYGDVGVPVFGG